jgi:hypothetical protein
MKKLFCLIALVAAFVASVNAQQVVPANLKLKWDANPAEDNVFKYRVYHHTDALGIIPPLLQDWQLLGEVNVPTTELNIGAPRSGFHVYVVTAVGSIDTQPAPIGIESDPSNDVHFRVPRPPSGTVIQLVVP